MSRPMLPSFEGGFILVDSILALGILVVCLIACSAAFALVIKGAKSPQSAAVAARLSQELLEEIRLRKWDKNTALPPVYVNSRSVIGIDSGETATSKAGWDDVDDFHNWRESPPQNPLGVPLPQFNGYVRSVSVQYVDTATLAAAGSKTDFKQVTVCTQWKNKKPACLSTLFANR